MAFVRCTDCGERHSERIGHDCKIDVDPERDLRAIDDYLQDMRAPITKRVKRLTSVDGLEVEEVRLLSRVERIDALLDRIRRYMVRTSDIEAQLETALSENRRLLLEYGTRGKRRA